MKDESMKDEPMDAHWMKDQWTKGAVPQDIGGMALIPNSILCSMELFA